MDHKAYRMIENHFPRLAEHVIDCYYNSPWEIIVELDNGSKQACYPHHHMLRFLPDNCDAITEAECRREFGIRLRYIMMSYGITQTELSEMTGITQSKISQYINSKALPSFYNTDKIAKAIGCPVDYFRYSDINKHT